MAETPIEPSAPFGSALCGIDASPESREAARQALALTSEEATAWAVSVWDPGEALMGGIHASEVMIELRREAARSLQVAREQLPGLDPILIKGHDVAGLLAAAANLEPELLAVGAHGRSRVAGVLFGSVATAMARHAPCSVLIGRAAGAAFPGRILHASDGSPGALDAARVAGQIAAIHDATVLSLHVTDDAANGRGVAEASLNLIEESGREPAIQIEQGSPQRRIVEMATETEAGLIVLGSRGRTGLKALGSVSEHVAHRARCSVLIVRRVAHPSRDDEWTAVV